MMHMNTTEFNVVADNLACELYDLADQVEERLKSIIRNHGIDDEQETMDLITQSKWDIDELRALLSQ